MSKPKVFTCIDCSTLVLSFGNPAANDQPICAECLWLRSVEDPAEREKLRQWLSDRRH